jgi:hypothetical protein
MEYVGIVYGDLFYFTAILCILWSFGIFCGHLVYFVVIWYILCFLYISTRFGKLYQEKSGKPAGKTRASCVVFTSSRVSRLFFGER